MPETQLDEKAQRILSVAFELAEEGGFEAVRLRDVAQRAEVAQLRRHAALLLLQARELGHDVVHGGGLPLYQGLGLAAVRDHAHQRAAAQRALVLERSEGEGLARAKVLRILDELERQDLKFISRLEVSQYDIPPVFIGFWDRALQAANIQPGK